MSEADNQNEINEAKAEYETPADATTDPRKDAFDTPSEKAPFPKPGMEHTKHNTSVDVSQERAWEDRDGEPGEEKLRLFLGTSKKQFELNAMLLALTVERDKQLRKPKKERDPAKLAAAEQNLEAYRKEHFSDLTQTEFVRYTDDFIRFNQDSIEEFFFKSAMNEGRQWENRTAFAEGMVEPDIIARRPSTNGKFDIAEMMVRASRRASGSAQAWDCLVRDSFLNLRVDPSDQTELAQLIDDILKEVKGYVRSMNGNSLTLARIAMYRVFWDYLMKKVSGSSMKGVDDFRQLGRILNLDDLKVIFVKFIQENEVKVPLLLYCTQPGCGWNGTKDVDPSWLLWHDKTLMDKEQAAALGNIRNGVKTYSIEDVIKLKKRFKHIDDNKLYFDNGRQFLLITRPTIQSAFTAYDVFMEYITPRIDKLRAKHVNDVSYQQELQASIDSVRSLEYLHWVGELHILPEPGVDEKPVIFKAEDNPAQFYAGVLQILNDEANGEISRDLIRYVHKRGPEFSTQTVGVPNAACPHCHGEFGGETAAKGITPIDPFTSFFILSRLWILDKQIKNAQV